VTGRQLPKLVAALRGQQEDSEVVASSLDFRCHILPFKTAPSQRFAQSYGFSEETTGVVADLVHRSATHS